MDDEKRYRKQSGIITAAIQVVVFIIIYFAVAWREPNPPIPEYGVELSFGLVESGANPEVPVDQPEEITEQNEVVEETEPEEENVEETIESQADESELSESVDEVIETQEVESPDVIEEQPEEKKMEEEPVKENSPVDKSTVEKKEEVKKQEEVNREEEVKKEEAPKQVKENTTTEETEKGNTNVAGDQGDPESTIDERALYGKKGSGDLDGASLQMTGWSWDSKPNPQDKSDETGKVVFQLKIDQDGYIIEIKTITSTVTPKVEQVYRRSIEQLTFSQTSQYQPAPFSTGTITFIIKSK